MRSLERDDKDYRSRGGPIRQYLNWSLNQLSGAVGPRDIDLSDRLEDETLALGYFLLLDEYGVAQSVFLTTFTFRSSELKRLINPARCRVACLDVWPT